MREEQKREGSKYGELIQSYIRDGLIVPMEVTIALLENAMKESIEKDNKTRFLIDGFPRKMDQADKFEETVVESKFVLYFTCSEETLLERLLKRGETSGRVDDNIESIKKRFRVFKETSFPVIEAFEKKNKVRQVRCCCCHGNKLGFKGDKIIINIHVSVDQLWANCGRSIQRCQKGLWWSSLDVPHRNYNKNTIVICLEIFDGDVDKCLMGLKRVTAGKSLQDKMDKKFSTFLVCFFILWVLDNEMIW